tara:strand:- start:702 stop:1268 length:567 start_codon:yes stop_codon:yes gene_type:complete
MHESIQVKDDILPWQDFQNLAYTIMKSPVYLPYDSSATEGETDGSVNDFGLKEYPNVKIHESIFSTLLYQNQFNGAYVSNIFKGCDQIVKKLLVALECKELFTARVSCTTGQAENYVSQFHTDFAYDPRITKTAILYLNANNGGTKFEHGDFVQSKPNRVCLFPSDMVHAGVWCTDKKLRFITNFNYQ